jgi:hypothetical protein
MRRTNWAWSAGALLGIPAVFSAAAYFDTSFELGVMHSTWQSGVVLLTFVVSGLYFLWCVSFRARWQRFAAMVAYAPTMFFFMAWLGLVIQFEFDDCMSAQQAIQRRWAAERQDV